MTVDISFRDGKLEKAVLTGTMPREREFTVCYGGSRKQVRLAGEEWIVLTEVDF